MQRMPTAAVITTANTAARYPALATNFRMPLWSPAPNFWATGMAKPVAAPMQKPLIMKLMEPVEPTAARDVTPRHWPTTMVSTML